MRQLLPLLFVLLGACPKENNVTEPIKTEPTQTEPTKTENTEAATTEVTLVGIKSVMVMQHPISPSFSPGKPEPQMWYMDINGDTGKQAVFYSEKVPDCRNKIEVKATPRKVTASKGGDDITFTQYDVTQWKCL